MSTAAKMRRKKLLSKRNERAASREQAAMLARYANTKAAIRETIETKARVLDAITSPLAGLGARFAKIIPFPDQSGLTGARQSAKVNPVETQLHPALRNVEARQALASLISKHKERSMSEEAKTIAGDATATEVAATASDEDSPFESDMSLSFSAWIGGLQEFDQSTILTNINTDSPNEDGLFAIVPIVVGRGDERAVKFNATVEMPTFEEMLSNNPDFFKGAYDDMVEGRISRGVRAFASGRATTYDLPVIVRNEDGSIDLSSWNEVRRRVGRVGVDKSWSQLAKSMCEMLKKKTGFAITPRDLRSALSNAEMAGALFPRVAQPHWVAIIDIAINFATSQTMPTKYLENWKATRDARKASSVDTFSLADLA